MERVEPEDIGEVGKVHYLPHHAVLRRDKETTKVRIVYDASSRMSGPSLNNCLHTGPKYNQKILEIFLRFRSYPVAVVADVEKAFLMISVDPKDRDVLRFLWVKNVKSEEPEIVILRFARVVFGVTSSPFLLNATIRPSTLKHNQCWWRKFRSQYTSWLEEMMMKSVLTTFTRVPNGYFEMVCLTSDKFTVPSMQN